MNARLWSATVELSKLTIRDLEQLERVRPGAGVHLLHAGMMLHGLSGAAHHDYLTRPMTSVSCDFPEDLGVKRIVFVDDEGNKLHEQDLKTGQVYTVKAEPFEAAGNSEGVPFCDKCQSFHSLERADELHEIANKINEEVRERNMKRIMAEDEGC